MNLPSYSVRYLIKILSYAKGGMEITKEEASKGIGFLLPRKATTKAKAFKRARSARKAAKSEKHRLSTAEIRAAVRERAGGVCENCCTRWGFWLWSLDHWEGGSGRRRERQTVENCWALCGTGTTGCHGKRTRNEPSAEHWNGRFKLHCARKGLPIPIEHVVHAPVPRRSA